MNDRSASGHLVAALLLFAISVLAAMLMVLTALVVWLSSLTGSFVLSAVIIGAFFALVALAIYRFSICEELRRIRTQIETVYEVAYAARSGYEWLVAKVVRLLRPREGQSSE
ncbi:hypothetical protein [uncultured Alistipes sp.]|uniref:hypothetical protein n=1 Tax=uncultured Alistipes sp. TaxID=538949 RepID=UPI001F948914|nr:hypothetical protein [uncultured Alistipes sp.]HJC26444.1 hypothetical protein [Candidatus Alistipes stercoravium]